MCGTIVAAQDASNSTSIRSTKNNRLSILVNLSMNCHCKYLNPKDRHAVRRRRWIVMLVCSIATLCSNGSAQQRVDTTRVEYIDNGSIKLGVNLKLGGAITYLADSKSGKNVVNNWDWGRQIQMSYFGHPVPYIEKGQKPREHWKHIGWNPIQAGDDFGNGSKVVNFKKTKTGLYIKCIPMQWPLNNVPGECTFESWIEVKGKTVQVRNRLNNARSDKNRYAGRHQELPAVYTNGEFYRLMTYRGDKPFTGDRVDRIPKRKGGGFPWDNWLATENWAALVNDKDWGLGIYKPDNYLFIGGFAGEEGRGGTHDTSTGYMAPLHTEILDHDITYEYEYALILGSLSEIRDYAIKQGREKGLPDWRFDKDRQHWHYSAAEQKGTDAGWPIHGFIELDLANPGMAAISPPCHWKADDAPVLNIQAAFKTAQKKSVIAWSKFKPNEHRPNFESKNYFSFDIIGDGKFRTYKIDLTKAAAYSGSLSYLMLKPIPNKEKNSHVKIARIWLER